MRDCLVSLRVLVAAALLPACAEQPAPVAFDLADPPAADLASVPDLGTVIPGPGPRCSGKGGTAGDLDRMIHVGGEDRRYVLHVPPGYDPEVPMPLVVAYHGLTETPEEMRDKTHFDAVADARGFLVAYPAGRFKAWNAGTCCGVPVATQIDDVAFSRALLDELTAGFCIDDKRVFASGFSNGGFMAHRVGCEMADRFAAIGVVAGQMSMAACTPGRAVPVVQVHGTSDPLVPYGGNPVLGFPATQATIEGWAMRDGCTADAAVISTEGSVTCVRRSGCDAGAEVILCTNQGGQHDWVGGGDDWTTAGPPPGFVTTHYFADFFAKHPMP